MVIEAIDVGASTPLCINEVLYDKKKKKQLLILTNWFLNNLFISIF